MANFQKAGGPALEGDQVVLRDWRRSDVEVSWRTPTDPHGHAVTDDKPWVPEPLEAALARFDKRLTERPPDVVQFAVSRRDDPEQAYLGNVQLWGLDLHNRISHLGIGLLPQVRGQGLGREILGLICRYGFEARDLYRLQLETLATNLAMQKAALACGFVQEGRLRQNAWVMGERQDELIFGLLAPDWRAAR